MFQWQNDICVIFLLRFITDNVKLTVSTLALLIVFTFGTVYSVACCSHFRVWKYWKSSQKAAVFDGRCGAISRRRWQRSCLMYDVSRHVTPAASLLHTYMYLWSKRTQTSSNVGHGCRHLVNMSTPLSPEGVPQTDGDSASWHRTYHLILSLCIIGNFIFDD